MTLEELRVYKEQYMKKLKSDRKSPFVGVEDNDLDGRTTT